MSSKTKNQTDSAAARAPPVAKPEKEESEEESEEEEPKKPAVKPAPKPKATEESEEEEEDDEEDEDEQPQAKPAAKKPAAKAPVKKEESDDEDEEEESDEDKPAAKKSAAKPVSKTASKPASKANAKKASSDEEESESDEEEAKPKSAAKPAAAKSAPAKSAAKPAAAKASAAKKKEDLDDILADFATPEGDAKAAAAKQLKRQRQKEKEKEKEKAAGSVPAAGAATTEAAAGTVKPDEKKPVEKPAAKGAKADDKKPKKANKNIEAMRLRLQQQKEEEAKAILDAQIAKEKAEAEIKRLEDEEKAKEAAALAKQEAKKKKRDEQRAQGKPMTKAQKEAARKAAAFREELAKSGAVVGLQSSTASASSNDAGETDAAADKPDKPAEKHEKHEKHKPKAKPKVAQKSKTQLEAERIRATLAEKEKEKVVEVIEPLEQLKEWEPVSDDSESELEEEAEPAAPKRKERVKDSWDDDSGDEKEESSPSKNAAAVSARKEASLARRKVRQERRAAVAAIRAENQAASQRNAAKLQARQKAKQEKREREEKEREARELENAGATGRRDSGDATSGAGASGANEAKKGGGSNRDLRSPICVVMGHVDAGKTKILDNLRHSNVGAKEAGGITQQIGATFFPMSAIEQRTAEIRTAKQDLAIPAYLKQDLEVKYPGLLIIDTPGHESFTNLRSRGSSLCDIAILVIDIKSGIQKQTDESIEMLRQRKTPFVVALNKVDRMFGWVTNKDAPFLETLKRQREDAQSEFQSCADRVLLQLKERGFNTALYYNNSDPSKYVSVVPVSAATGEGMPDLLLLICSLTQTRLNARLQYVTELQCIVLEVKVVEGHGTTLDVILVNGVLREGDTILLCGLQGPITTTIRSLLTPAPMTEMRVKTEFMPHKEVKAAMGVKISAHNLDGAIAGSQLLVARKNDDLEELKNEVMSDLQTILAKVGRTREGIFVQASTLGSMEAMITFLENKKIPVSGMGLGPLYKHHVVRSAVQLEHRMEYATILAFDVKISAEAQQEADAQGVKIIQSDVIYTLFDECTKYFDQIRQMRREETKDEVVFPVILKVMKDHVYRIKNPIVLGCKVLDGKLRLNTPLIVPAKNDLFIGRVIGIQKDHKDQTEAKKDEEVAVKIGVGGLQQTVQVQYGRHFNADNELVSRLTRDSIDLLKANFKDDLSEDEWKTVVRIKKFLNIA